MLLFDLFACTRSVIRNVEMLSSGGRRWKKTQLLLLLLEVICLAQEAARAASFDLSCPCYVRGDAV